MRTVVIVFIGDAAHSSIALRFPSS